MMKRYIISLTLMAGLFVSAFVGVHAYAANDPSKTAACQAIGGTLNDGECSVSEASSSPQDMVATVITIFSWVVGAIAVVMLIFGGFRYITSGGDSGKITSAKNTIIYALVGIVIVALSQVIVNFVLNKTNCATNPSAAGCTQQKK